MKKDRLIRELDLARALIEKWTDKGAIPEIERDMALQNLRSAYGQLLSIKIEAIPATAELETDQEHDDVEVELIFFDENEEPEHTPSPESTDNAPVHDEELADQEEEHDYDIKQEQELAPESEPLQEEEPDYHIEPEPAQEHDQEEEHDYLIEKKPEPKLEEEQDYQIEPKLEPEQEHEQEQEQEPAPEAKPEPAYLAIFGQQVLLADIVGFITELFGDDDQLFATEVSRIAAMASLDEALIYISERYNWNAQSPAAAEFTALLMNYEFEQQ